jgi:hypothetical protein
MASGTKGNFLMNNMYLRGFVIPPGYRKYVKWVNDTPHLSAKAANLHRKLLPTLGKGEDHSTLVYEWLKEARVEKADKAYTLYRQLGPRGTFQRMIEVLPSSSGSQKFLAKMLQDEKDIWKIDPSLDRDSYPVAVKILHGAISAIKHPKLRQFESKNLLKYAGDANRRNFEGYVSQVANYLPQRPAFAKAKIPRMDAYDTALTMQYDMFSSSERSIQNLISMGDFLKSARRDTFGGPPYYKNMAEFLNIDDPEDMTSYADLYDELALLFLFLPPMWKERISNYYTYSALERVQTGGIGKYSGTEVSLDDFDVNANKQRFVQAESAVFPRALKAIHDFMRDIWKRYPTLAADKFSEEEVTSAMKRVTRAGLDAKDNIQGADYTNFDASIELCSLNDSYFNVIRMHMPDWVNYYIVDPYFKIAFKSQIFVPGVGLITTTGIKSGMVITNQGDCYYANFCDLYELVRYQQDFGQLSPEQLEIYLRDRMINGDDRYRRTVLSAAMVEKYDSELQLIAQKSKQEMFVPGQDLDEMAVTYLKTALMHNDDSLIRVDSIAKIILSRYNRERPRLESAPYSLVIESLMASSRNVEHPDQWVFISWLYHACEPGRRWLDGELSLEEVNAHAVVEQMSELKRTKGKKWLLKKQVDPDYIIQRMAENYGFVSGGHRESDAYVETNKDGKKQFKLELLPIVQAVFAEHKKITPEQLSTFAPISRV